MHSLYIKPYNRDACTYNCNTMLIFYCGQRNHTKEGMANLFLSEGQCFPTPKPEYIYTGNKNQIVLHESVICLQNVPIFLVEICRVRICIAFTFEIFFFYKFWPQKKKEWKAIVPHPQVLNGRSLSIAMGVIPLRKETHFSFICFHAD